MSRYIVDIHGELEGDFEIIAPYIDRVIRCKECKHREYRHSCGLVEGLTVLRDDSYCSYAERREEKK